MTSLSLFTFMHWRRKWQPTPVFLPGESPGWGSLVGCRLWNRTESDTTEATWQQQTVSSDDLMHECEMKKPRRGSTWRPSLRSKWLLVYIQCFENSWSDSYFPSAKSQNCIFTCFLYLNTSRKIPSDKMKS